MTRKEKHSKIFVVVKVHSGLPVVAEAFLNEGDANECAAELKKNMNIEYDEIDIIQTLLC